MVSIIKSGNGRAVRCTRELKQAGVAAGDPRGEAHRDRMYIIGVGNCVVALSKSSVSPEQRAHVVGELAQALGHVGISASVTVQINGGSFGLQVTPACNDLRDDTSSEDASSFAEETEVAVRVPTYEDEYDEEEGLGVVVVGPPTSETDEVAEAVRQMRLSHVRDGVDV